MPLAIRAGEGRGRHKKRSTLGRGVEKALQPPTNIFRDFGRMSLVCRWALEVSMAGQLQLRSSS